MKIGDLVRPKARTYRDQIGVVIRVGFVSGVSVRLMCGRVATYNKGSLEIINEA